MFSNLTSKLNGLVRKGAQITKKGGQFLGKLSSMNKTVARAGMKPGRMGLPAKPNQKGMMNLVKRIK